MVESQWKTEEIIAELDANITMEEHVNGMVSKSATVPTRTDNNNNMCLNCGREGHFVKDCTTEGCRRCQDRKHNHVLCPRRMELGKHRNLPQNTSTMKTSAAPTMQKPAHAQQRTDDEKTRTTGRITQAHPIQT
ncbi:zinc knuckle [Ancylostoma duodenale]|uniref:Zinc knuckle n=1 Tax=Ancylostoma duodenale TaxID=51022 RepID=A0A0C2FCE3_9BILA|nr:zinc knuckle [Ancylostoma duodenale]